MTRILGISLIVLTATILIMAVDRLLWSLPLWAEYANGAVMMAGVFFVVFSTVRLKMHRR